MIRHTQASPTTIGALSRVLAALKADIWLTPHPEMFNLEAKRQRAIKMGVQDGLTR
jgi:hypothetical protein